MSKISQFCYEAVMLYKEVLVFKVRITNEYSFRGSDGSEKRQVSEEK